MLDHISTGVSDLDRGMAFYDTALAALGFARCMTFDQAAGYGADDRPVFWIGLAGEAAAPSKGFHVAFRADSRSAVDAFHAAAMAAGASDNGQPGLRPRYHPNYYAAFVIDPDGHKLEAVCHRPE